MEKWRLKSVRQCQSCPWLKNNNPAHLIELIGEQHPTFEDTITDEK